PLLLPPPAGCRAASGAGPPRARRPSRVPRRHLEGHVAQRVPELLRLLDRGVARQAEQPSQKRITPTDFEASQLRAVVELLHEPAVPIPLRPERAREREPDRGLQDGLVV